MAWSMDLSLWKLPLPPLTLEEPRRLPYPPLVCVVWNAAEGSAGPCVSEFIGRCRTAGCL